MGNLKAGFARIDITPPLGTRLVGYPRIRRAEGILDPLLATAVAVSDGENTAIMMSIDLIGIDQGHGGFDRQALIECDTAFYTEGSLKQITGNMAFLMRLYL